MAWLSEDEAAGGVAGGDDVEAGGDGEGPAALDGLGIYEDGAVNGVYADGRFGVGHDLDAARDGG